jgi:DNA adenine methylase
MKRVGLLKQRMIECLCIHTKIGANLSLQRFPSNSSNRGLQPALFQQDAEALRPPLKWAGGKRWLLNEIKPHWRKHRHRRYVEPFCGGLAMALGLQPKTALLNDINPHLVNFYLQLQRGLTMHIDARNHEDLFYEHRQRFNELIKTGQAKTPEAAQLFYFLNRTCFNGLCRFNRSGEYNVPFGKYKTINYAKDFMEYSAILSSWNFLNLDLELVPIRQDDFIYADPPYDVEFTSYSAGGFSWADQVRTGELLAAHRGPVLLSNQATPRIIELYSQLGFHLQFFDAPRRISCTGDRMAAREILAMKGL